VHSCSTAEESGSVCTDRRDKTTAAAVRLAAPRTLTMCVHVQVMHGAHSIEKLRQQVLGRIKMVCRGPANDIRKSICACVRKIVKNHQSEGSRGPKAYSVWDYVVMLTSRSLKLRFRLKLFATSWRNAQNAPPTSLLLRKNADVRAPWAIYCVAASHCSCAEAISSIAAEVAVQGLRDGRGAGVSCAG